MTFRQFLRSRGVTDDAAGDFVADALEDRTLPRIKSWDVLEGYMRCRHAIPDAIEAAREVWAEYSATLG